MRFGTALGVIAAFGAAALAYKRAGRAWVRDWGASRTGTYAFVSPVIAVAIGTAVFGERLDIGDVVGMLLMLGAAAIVLKRG